MSVEIIQQIDLVSATVGARELMNQSIGQGINTSN